MEKTEQPVLRDPKDQKATKEMRDPKVIQVLRDQSD